MKLNRIFIVLSLMFLVLFSNASAQNIATAIDKKVAEYVGAGSPGVAVVVLKGSKVLHVKAYGLANLETKSPITTDSVFDIASVSKQVTAVAVLTLVESGKVKLDEPVTAYIKDFAVKEEERAVTIRDLLQMTSGLVDYSTADWDGREKEFSQLNLASHLEWVNDTEPTDAPGTKFHYNNTNYALLAQIVERVSGKSFGQYMKEKIFTPAGMSRSFVVDKLGMKYENPVTGYKNEKAPFVKSFSPVQMPGDGNVYSTIEDMAAWANAMRTNKIISAKTRAMAWSARKLDDGKAVMYDDEETYGFGWKLNAAKKIVSHSGSWYGTAAYFLHYPELDDTVVVLSNNESLDVAALAGEIGDLF